ncbi:MAG: RdgB/HAM1 family non-canonical purine NTP pyrophosphatase [Clostridia bacterium]|nr:RdgB/HAM1 family non-canonical purine NTP pyrophosphatase [Clostridia bacterium]MBQ6059766.1 RdgB/HAM1 family non-canonical purine NTP pyrophosphatase [Clostridia bacterium]
MNRWKFSEVVMATGNKGKMRELAVMLEPLGVKVLSPEDCGIQGLHVEETGETFEQNAVIKALAYCRASGIAAVADDSGLCVDALDGAPGVYSARFGGPGLSDGQRVELLLSRMKEVKLENRGAHFTSAIALALPDGGGFVVTGECYGMIALEPSGEGGFGYDPVFFYAPEGCTFADMSEESKNRVSHRAVAMRLLVEQLERSREDNADE